MVHIESKYMEFMYCSDAGKTKIISVVNKRSGFLLGEIRWYGPWRQYCFVPMPDSVFNRDCLNEINLEINLLMDERKQKETP